MVFSADSSLLFSFQLFIKLLHARIALFIPSSWNYLEKIICAISSCSFSIDLCFNVFLAAPDRLFDDEADDERFIGSPEDPVSLLS